MTNPPNMFEERVDALPGPYSACHNHESQTQCCKECLLELIRQVASEARVAALEEAIEMCTGRPGEWIPVDHLGDVLGVVEHCKNKIRSLIKEPSKGDA